jgi:hypothetical protein
MWKAKLIEPGQLRTFLKDPDVVSLSEQAIALLEQQKSVWPSLRDGYKNLDDVVEKDVEFGNFPVQVQYNPKRMTSSSAKTDEKSIRERRCFLCPHNLPEEQRGLMYEGKYLILCNPAPIFREHFTISHVEHKGQCIVGTYETLLNLARDLSPSFSLLYNGPKCGASAPDHLHFQASTRSAIPVEKQLDRIASTPVRKSALTILKQIDCVEISTLNDFGRSVVILNGRGARSMSSWFYKILEGFAKIAEVEEEPMINLIATYLEGNWTTIIFPREKHRPSCYFAEGDAQLIISPASVDIGGLIITPREKDFRRVDGAVVREVYSEVTLSEEKFSRLLDTIINF